MSDYTDIYKNLLIKQYWDKTNAVAEVELRAGAYERVYQILRDFETEFDLDTADGDRLDKIGKIVGISREDLEPYFDLFFGFNDNPNSLPMGFKFSTYITQEYQPEIDWTVYATAENNEIYRCAYDEDHDRFILVSYTGTYRCQYSADGGESWNGIAMPSALQYFDVHSHHGTTIAVASNGSTSTSVSKSTDGGSTWAHKSTPGAGFMGVTYGEGIGPGDGRWLVVGGSVGYYSDDDGETWNACTAITATDLLGASFRNGRYVISGNFYVAYSDDGDTFTDVSLGGGRSFFDVDGDGAGNWVTVGYTWPYGSTTKIMYSDDNAVTWHDASGLPDYGSWWGVVWDEDSNEFVAVRDNGANRIGSSSNGQSWSTEVAPEANDWRGIIFGSGRLVGVAGSGTNRSMLKVLEQAEQSEPVPEYTAGKFFDKFYTNTIPGILTDDEYRFYIKAKIAVNSASGYMVSDDYISIQSVIQYLFNGYAIVFDDMVMSLTLEVEDSIPRGRVLLARDINLLPRPQGVEYNTVALAGYDYFGWDDDPNAGGWGTWSDSSIGGIFATYL